MSPPGESYDPEVVSRTDQKIEEPPLYSVLLHNDDFTTMDFVIYVLRTIFRHPEGDAVRLMLQVHTQGYGLAGVYTREIAETKVTEVVALAQTHEHPLLCTMEPARTR
jgi:ATP-dependent Clp protease adaptor protein ClpS